MKKFILVFQTLKEWKSYMIYGAKGDLKSLMTEISLQLERMGYFPKSWGLNAVEWNIYFCFHGDFRWDEMDEQELKSNLLQDNYPLFFGKVEKKQFDFDETMLSNSFSNLSKTQKELWNNRYPRKKRQKVISMEYKSRTELQMIMKEDAFVNFWKKIEGVTDVQLFGRQVQILIFSFKPEQYELERIKQITSEFFPNEQIQVSNVNISHESKIVNNTECLPIKYLSSLEKLRREFRYRFWITEKGQLESVPWYKSLNYLKTHSFRAVGFLPTVVVNRMPHFLVQKRNPRQGNDPKEEDWWNFISGHVEDSDETLMEAISREMKEELGYNLLNCNVQHLSVIAFGDFILFQADFDIRVFRNAVQWKPNYEVDNTYVPKYYQRYALLPQPPNGYDWFSLQDLLENNDIPLLWGPPSRPNLTLETLKISSLVFETCFGNSFYCQSF